jgi:hypothetical protein
MDEHGLLNMPVTIHADKIGAIALAKKSRTSCTYETHCCPHLYIIYNYIYIAT